MLFLWIDLYMLHNELRHKLVLSLLWREVLIFRIKSKGRRWGESFIDPEAGIKGEGREICNSTLFFSRNQVYIKPNIIKVCSGFGGYENEIEFLLSTLSSNSCFEEEPKISVEDWN
jgi:hypothetical protein